MKTLNKAEITKNVSKQSIIKNRFYGYIMPLSDLKKTLLLDNIPKFLSIFGLAGFCVSIIYLLLCPFLFPNRWPIAFFQIILFGGIYYYGTKKTKTSICCDGV